MPKREWSLIEMENIFEELIPRLEELGVGPGIIAINLRTRGFVLGSTLQGITLQASCAWPKINQNSIYIRPLVEKMKIEEKPKSQAENKARLEELLRPRTPDELKKLRPISKKKIKEALEKGRQAAEACSQIAHCSRRRLEGLFFRKR